MHENIDNDTLILTVHRQYGLLPTLHSGLVQKICQLKVAVARRQVLGEALETGDKCHRLFVNIDVFSPHCHNT